MDLVNIKKKHIIIIIIGGIILMVLFGIGKGLFPQSQLSGLGLNNNRIDDLDVIIIRKNPNQALGNDVFEEITFETDEFISNPAMRVGGTSRIIIQKDGIYVITANIRFANNATGTREGWILKNESGGGGTTITQCEWTTNAAGTLEVTMTGVKELFAGDNVAVFARQDSGGDLNLRIGSRLAIYQLKEGLY